MMPRRLGVLVVAGLGLLRAADAHAYVRSTTKEQIPTAWDDPNIPLLLYVGDAPAFLDRATIVTAVHAAAAAWGKTALSCTAILMSVTEVEEAVAPASIDKVNRIGFRRDEWKKWPCDPAKEMCAPYQTAAIAITTVTSSTKTGQIVDADMEINAVDKKFVDVVADGDMHAGSDVHDLQNTVTHELGHLIGLDHTCWNQLPTGRPVPKDNHGVDSPNCGAGISKEIHDATMFAQAVSRETDKRSLEADDIQAVCDIYPVGYQGQHGSTDDERTRGCAVGGVTDSAAHAGDTGGAWAWLALAGCVGLGARRIKNRRR
jgi:hypothetical protein